MVNDELVVTGTRVRSGFTAPTPLQVLDSAALEERGATNPFTVLSELPSVSSRTSSASSGIRFQAAGQNFVDLRSLGTSRTLVLVNGRRFVPSVPNSSSGTPYQVDVNLIPALMIERMDVVTGGASAAYGSDAVAGVLNIVLKDRVEGLQGELQSGISERGDAAEYRLGLVGGLSFGEGRGHIVLSGDYVKNKGIPDYRARGFATRFWNFFGNPASTAANGQPKQILVTDLDTQPGNRTAGGLIVGASGGTLDQRTGLIGLQFDSPSTVSQFVRGLYNPAGITNAGTNSTGRFAGNQAGGENPDLNINSLIPPSERKIIYGRADYDVTDTVNLFVEGSWGKSAATFQGNNTSDQVSVYNPVTASGTLVRIYADNPYIPAAIRGLIPAPAGASTATVPTQSFLLARANYDMPPQVSTVTDTAYTFAGGLRGDVKGGWVWDLSYGYGRNKYHRFLPAGRDRSLYALAADAITDPVSGRVICRSTLTNPTNGCVPMNLFGAGSPSAAAMEYVTEPLTSQVVYVQQSAQFNVSGSPFDTWAGPVAVAAGVEWRHETLDASVSPASAETDVYDSSVGKPFDGAFTVKEGYAEATVPLAKDLPFARSLAVNGAVRHAKYSGDAAAAGGQTTWKVGATYEPFDGLMLRAVRSLDIRAPNLYELRVTGSQSIQTVTYGNQVFSSVRITSDGNLNLKPEKSKTFTVGGSFSPSFVPRLRLSVDYFNISVNDVITTFGTNAIAASCSAGIQDFCNLLTFTGPNQTGSLVALDNPFLNLSSIKTKGVDFNLNYAVALGAGELRLRSAATYVDRFTITAPTNPPSVNEYAGDNSNNEFAVPNWRGNASLTYAWDKASVTLQTLYVGPGRKDGRLSEVGTPTSAPDVTAADNHVPDYFLFNLSGTVDVLEKGRAQFFWVVNNLFDRDPLFVPRAVSRSQTNGGLYDVIGRNYRIGLRFKI
jgi:outer membrane receptor protein involved in Fe transport